MSDSQAPKDLAIVIPVYNEAKNIGKVIDDWAGECERLAIDYIILVYDAKSTDGTLDILDEAARNRPGRIDVHVCPKLPHGPSVLRGYRQASTAWVFQNDSDGEMGPEKFHELWERRNDYDILMGRRHERQSNWARQTVTACARFCVRVIFGSPVSDANTPYRLMRKSALTEIFSLIPDDAIAPNVMISGLVGVKKLRLYEIDIHHASRPVGSAGLVKLKLWKIAFRAFAQTLKVRFRA